MLSAEIVRAQGIDILGIFFETPFFSSKRAVISAASMGLPFKVIDITERHLEVVRRPRHGYGGNMNPCIDCHALMFRIAGELLSQEGASFIVTGEVLGQRPMSQNMASLNLTAKESGFASLILRPLSARRLLVTLPEEKGWINRDLLLDFHGRSRKPQMALASRLGIKDYPAPAGGCLLTEKVFSRRLKDLFENMDDVLIRDIELLKLGRHFKVAPSTKAVVGRNKKENKTIVAHSQDSDLLLSIVGIPGPTVIVTGRNPFESVQVAGSITAAYSDAKQGEDVTVRIVSGKRESFMKTTVTEKRTFRDFML